MGKETQKKLVLQINSLPVLEQFFGPDVEANIDIRQAVVNKFCDKHLSKLVSASALAETEQRIHQSLNHHMAQLTNAVKNRYEDRITAEIGTLTKKNNWDPPVVTIKPEIEQQLSATIRKNLSGYIDKMVADSITTILPTLRNTINEIVTREVKTRIKQEVLSKLNTI